MSFGEAASIAQVVKSAFEKGEIDELYVVYSRFLSPISQRPTVLKLLPNQLLALGRMFPIFREAIAHQLINEACLTNASYAFSTGLAEIVPVLALPLTVTDMVVLTKNQAFLVYRLGLLFGFSTRWQDYVAEFGSVIGNDQMPNFNRLAGEYTLLTHNCSPPSTR